NAAEVVTGTCCFWFAGDRHEALSLCLHGTSEMMVTCREIRVDLRTFVSVLDRHEIAPLCLGESTLAVKDPGRIRVRHSQLRGAQDSIVVAFQCLLGQT